MTAKAAAVTDEEIDRKAKADSSLSRDEVRKSLWKEKVAIELTKFVATLERKSSVRVMLDPPRAPRSILEPAKAPSKGPANASVTIVEFNLEPLKIDPACVSALQSPTVPVIVGR